MSRMALIVLLGSLFPMNSIHSAENEDAKLTAFFEKYLDEEFRRRPMAATRLGDHRFDHLLDDLSSRARAGWSAEYRKILEGLPKQINYQKLSRSGQIDFELFKHQLEASLWLADNTRPFESDPRAYNDHISDSVFLPLAQSTLYQPASGCGARKP